jgi:aspartate/methionine/tyrosine aminotransferase
VSAHCDDALPLVFVLDGLSKGVALPQLKLAWILVGGAPACVDAALAGLEWIADAYLSVGSVVQNALPLLLRLAPAMQLQIRTRIAANLCVLCDCLKGVPSVMVLAADGGWYAVLRVPRVMNEEEWVTTLLFGVGVVVQPGYYFDFAHEGFLVVSLLLPLEEFAEGARRLAQGLGRLCVF